MSLAYGEFSKRVSRFIVGVDLLLARLRQIAGHQHDDQQSENVAWMMAFGITSRFVASNHDLTESEAVALHVLASHALEAELPMIDAENLVELREVARRLPLKGLLEPLAHVDATMGTPYASVAMILADRLASDVCELGGPPSSEGQRLRDAFWDEMLDVLWASGVQWEQTDVVGTLDDIESNLTSAW